MENIFASFELCEIQNVVDKKKFLNGRLNQAARRDNPQPIKIDIDYLIRLGKKQKWKCALSGVDLEFVSGKGKKNPYICTIDRIDSDKGYVKKNIQLLTWIANYAKGAFTVTEFKKLCEDVFLKEKGLK